VKLATIAAAAGISEGEARARIRALRNDAVRDAAVARREGIRSGVWTKDEAVAAFRAFEKNEGRLPAYADLIPPRLPSDRTIRRLFSTGIEGALAASGLTGYEVEQASLFEVEA